MYGKFKSTKDTMRSEKWLALDTKYNILPLLHENVSHGTVRSFHTKGTPMLFAAVSGWWWAVAVVAVLLLLYFLGGKKYF